MPIAGRVVSGKMRREDYPMYPPRATREAISNAFCHRDYTRHTLALIAIAMYSDHLERINPGCFYFGLTPEKLIRPHQSKLWNPLIADVLYRVGIIEKWGTGTLNILDWCNENGNPVPKWEDQDDSIIITFFCHSNFEEGRLKLAQQESRLESQQESRLESQQESRLQLALIQDKQPLKDKVLNYYLKIEVLFLGRKLRKV